MFDEKYNSPVLQPQDVGNVRPTRKITNPFWLAFLAAESPPNTPKSDWQYWNGRGFISLEDAARKISQPRMIIRDVLPERGVTLLNARRSTGKTLLALDQSLHIATDQDWQGIPTAKGRSVIYCAGEDASGVLQNIDAWCEHHNVSKRSLMGRFVFYDGVPDLMDLKASKAFVEHVRAMEPFDLNQLGPLIIIDTWQRATASGLQNEDKDMQTAIGNAEMIGRELGGAILCLSHPPKGNPKTISGSSVIENSSVAIWELSPDGKNDAGLNFEVTRIKNAGGGKTSRLRREVVSFDQVDEWGLPIQGALLVNDNPIILGAANIRLHANYLDDKDEKILQSYRDHPEISYAKREKATGIPKTTLMKRVDALITKGELVKCDGVVRLPLSQSDTATAKASM